MNAQHKTTARQLSTQDMLNNIKSIKLTNNGSAIKHCIMQLRNDELTSVDLFGWWWSVSHCLGKFYQLVML